MTSLNIVAHPDDDLLFLNPDLLTEIEQDRGAAYVVYMTPGDDGRDETYVTTRRNATRNAYDSIGANSYNYIPKLFWVKSNSFHNGDIYGDLFKLWYDFNYEANAFGVGTWKRFQVLSTLSHLIEYTKPDIIRTHDPDTAPAIDHDEPHLDHIDHIYTAKFVIEAAKVFPKIPVFAYEGYPIRYKEANVEPERAAKKLAMWRRYQEIDTSVAGEQWDIAATRMYKRQIQ